VYGDCGLPLFSCSKYSKTNCIAGIHVAGESSGFKGFAVPITTDIVRMAVSFYAKDVIYAQLSKGDHLIFSKGSFLDLPDADRPRFVGKTILGKLDAARVPSNTNIVRSPLYDNLSFDPKTVPAILRPFKNKEGVLIDPEVIGINKYSRSCTMDPPIVDMCVADYTDFIVNAKGQMIEKSIDKRVLTYREAVEGIAGVDGFDGIPRKTSPGYPYTLFTKKGTRGKQAFWGTEGPYEFESDENAFIEDRVNGIISDAKEGIRGQHLFMDFPKDERRPKAKAIAGKTRKISACPVDLAVAIRMYFGSFVQWYMANRLYNGSAVGINVYSSEIDALVKYMGTTESGEATRVVAGDFGNYDGSLPYLLIKRFLITVDAYYRDAGSENSRIRHVLMEELANSRHIASDGTVYEWVGSNASGNPLTTILNSWCNNVILRYAMVKASKPVNITKYLKDMRKFVKILAYGDDNLISIVISSAYGNITQKTLTDALIESGFEYTDENKSDECAAERNIFEVSFLKREFAKNSVVPGQRYTAALSLDTIMESIQWTKKKDEHFDSVRDNASKMIKELSLHSRSTFEKYTPTIVKACQDFLDFTPIPNDYDNCQRDCLSGGVSHY
jgi:hypothetical protein